MKFCCLVPYGCAETFTLSSLMLPPRMLDPVPNTDMNDGNETGHDGELVCTGMLDDRDPEDNDLRLLGMGIG
jgi:hypothetical protein